MSSGERIVFRAEREGLRFGGERVHKGQILDPHDFGPDRNWLTLVDQGHVSEMRISQAELERLQAEREAREEFERQKRAAQEALESAAADARAEYERATREANSAFEDAVAEARQMLDARLSEIRAE